MKSETEAYVCGQVKTKMSLQEFASLYADSKLKVRRSRYSIDFSHGNASVIGEAIAEAEILFQADDGFMVDALELARLLSEPLAGLDIAHRFEVYDEASKDLIGYFAHRWKPNTPEPEAESETGMSAIA